MRLGAAVILACLGSCQTALLAPIDKQPLKVKILDVFIGQDEHANGGSDPEPFIFIKTQFSMVDTREAVLEEMSYDLFVNGSHVGYAKFATEIGFSGGCTLDLTVRKLRFSADEAVKRFQKTRSAQLRGTLRYKMVTGGRYDHPFVADAVAGTNP